MYVTLFSCMAIGDFRSYLQCCEPLTKPYFKHYLCRNYSNEPVPGEKISRERWPRGPRQHRGPCPLPSAPESLLQKPVTSSPCPGGKVRLGGNWRRKPQTLPPACGRISLWGRHTSSPWGKTILLPLRQDYVLCQVWTYWARQEFPLTNSSN